MPDRLRPSAPIAERAILTGDPARAMMLAQELTAQPRMSNHARGLWGYLGVSEDGAELTVQATGTGAPSAAIVLRDLAGLGLRRAVRVGSCHSLDPDLAPGDVLVATSALAADGVSAALGRGDQAVQGDPALAAALLDAGEAAGFATGPVRSVDLIEIAGDRDRAGDGGAGMPEADGGSRAQDLQTAALFSVAPTLGVAVAAVLVVSQGTLGEEVGEQPFEAASKRAGRAALDALSG